MNTPNFTKLIETSKLPDDTEFIYELHKILDAIFIDSDYMTVLRTLQSTAFVCTNYYYTKQFSMLNRGIFITIDYGIKHKLCLNMSYTECAGTYTSWSTCTQFSPEIHKYVHSWIDDFKHFAIQDNEFKTDDSSDLVY